MLNINDYQDGNDILIWVTSHDNAFSKEIEKIPSDLADIVNGIRDNMKDLMNKNWHDCGYYSWSVDGVMGHSTNACGRYMPQIEDALMNLVECSAKGDIDGVMNYINEFSD